MYFAVISCLSSLSSSVADAHFPALMLLLMFLTRRKNMMAKVFEHRLTPNTSEYKIFLMNLRIVFKNTDSYNLKLKATLSAYVLLSQGIMKLTCRWLAVTSC